MTAWAYILRGSNGRHYIGSTIDLERRLAEHRRGNTHTTKRLGNTIELLASREFANLNEARRIERLLKAKKNPRLALYHLQHR
jgi:putative endonuclease